MSILNENQINELDSTSIGEQCRDLLVKDDFAYVSRYSDGVAVFSVSDPHYLSSLLSSTPASDARGSFKFNYYDDEILAVCNQGVGVLLVNVSNKSDIKEVSSYEGHACANGLSVLGDNYVLFCSTTSNALVVVNITDIQTPTFVSLVSITACKDLFLIDDELAYVVSTGYLKSVNISLLTDLEVVDSTTISNAYNTVCEDEGGERYCYVLDSSSHRISVVDVTDPSSISVVGSLTISGSWVDHLKKDGDYVYFSNSVLGWKVVDVRVKTLPVLVASVRFHEGSISSTGIDTKNNTVFVTDNVGNKLYSYESFKNVEISVFPRNEPAFYRFGVEVVTSSSDYRLERRVFDYDVFVGMPSCYGTLANETDLVCGGKGVCVSEDECICELFYHGFFCNVTECNGITSNWTNLVCHGGRGECVDHDVCVCFNQSLYFGPFCGEQFCFGRGSNDSSVCSDHGSCIDTDTCSCEEGYYGGECEIAICGKYLSNDTRACTGRGNCTEYDYCQCEDFYFGEECEVTTCEDTSENITYFSNHSEICSGHGECREFNNCTCIPDVDYTGDFCEDWNAPYVQHRNFYKFLGGPPN